MGESLIANRHAVSVIVVRKALTFTMRAPPRLQCSRPECNDVTVAVQSPHGKQKQEKITEASEIEGNFMVLNYSASRCIRSAAAQQ